MRRGRAGGERPWEGKELELACHHPPRNGESLATEEGVGRNGSFQKQKQKQKQKRRCGNGAPGEHSAGVQVALVLLPLGKLLKTKAGGPSRAYLTGVGD